MAIGLLSECASGDKRYQRLLTGAAQFTENTRAAMNLERFAFTFWFYFTGVHADRNGFAASVAIDNECSAH
jgi:hypothetical protein